MNRLGARTMTVGPSSFPGQPHGGSCRSKLQFSSAERHRSQPVGRRPARPPLRGGIAEKGARPETVGPRRFSGRSLRGPLERKRETAGLRGAKLRPVIVRSLLS